MDPIYDSLNSEQTLAVQQKDGPILINAGAGSGKTRVLTSKIALLLRDGVFPQEILALTFTKKAAEEMRSRVEKLVGSEAQYVVMGTFHSVFVRFLREYYVYIGYPERFTIYDADDSVSCLEDVIGETLFGPNWKDKETIKALSEDQKKERKTLLRNYKAKDVAARISSLKNDYILPDDYDNDPDQAVIDRVRKRPKLGIIYRRYVERCKRAGAMDFDDILINTLSMIQQHKDIYENIAKRFRYILVDEYQDTNAVQYSIVYMLAQAYRNICAVGDDSQSIYAFRGARITNILRFEKDFPDCKQYRLEANYRSTNEIVNAANSLIEKNEQRLPKRCYAVGGNGNQVETQFLKNDREEARYIAARIAKAHSIQGKSYNDFAVLYRTNAQARALEDALLKQHIPYVIFSGMSFFERMEVKDTLAYFRIIVNPYDDEAFKRICNKPARGISDTTLNTMLAHGGQLKNTLFETACTIGICCPELKPTAQKNVTAFIALINKIQEECVGLNAFESAKIILERSGLYEYYQNEKNEDGQKRTENIDELMNSISYFIQDQQDRYATGEGTLPKIRLEDYLEDIALLSSIDKDTKNSGEVVSLMTSHSSKGLEFDTVFVAGVEEGLYPSIRDENSKFEIEEERRLFYVSITRAKRELILTSCNERWKYNETISCEPSRFIEEMFEYLDPDKNDDLPE